MSESESGVLVPGWAERLARISMEEIRRVTVTKKRAAAKAKRKAERGGKAREEGS